MKILKCKYFLYLSICLFLFTGCINQWPDVEKQEFNVILNITEDSSWNPDYDITLTKGEDYKKIYLIRVYSKGEKNNPIKELSYFPQESSKEEQTVNFTLNPGKYDIYVWSEFIDSFSNSSLFYNTENFSDISIKEPYIGDTEYKDVKNGYTSLEIEGSYNKEATYDAKIKLNRPLAQYQFIANDLEDFLTAENKKGKSVDLNSYTVRITYPDYLPTVFNVFANNPVFSVEGISFTGAVTYLDNNRALMAFDYIMVNGENSSVNVIMELLDNNGYSIGKTGNIEVPVERNRITVLNGKFLTSLEEEGIGIDPDFKGDFNIEIK